MCVSPFSSSLRQFLSTNLKLDAKSQVHVRVCTVFISWHCVTIYATPFLRYHHDEEVNRKAPNINNNSNDDDDDHNNKKIKKQKVLKQDN